LVSINKGTISQTLNKQPFSIQSHSLH
jgi:hypothetical protein